MPLQTAPQAAAGEMKIVPEPPWDFDTDDLATWINSPAWPQPLAKIGSCTKFDQRAIAALIVHAVNTHAALLAENERMREALDQTWYRINAIGGHAGEYDDFGKGINYAVEQALSIIEELGGSDPLAKRAVNNGE